MANLDRPEEFTAVDPQGMLDRVEEFSNQCREGIEIGRAAPLAKKHEFRTIVVVGMGGSAIGGDLLHTCLAPSLARPWMVNRDYRLPPWVGPETLLLACSYSGNTEETLEAFGEAIARGASIVCVTSGGRLREAARERDLPLIEIPGGLQPRAALGYSFFPLAVLLGRMGLASVTEGELEEALHVIRDVRDRLGRSRPTAENPAKNLARSLQGRLPVIYAGPDLLCSVATRWKTQLNENSKILAYTNVFPELNHNEIEGWEGTDPHDRIHLVVLRDRGDSPRIQHRIDVTLKIISGRAAEITELWSEGSGRIARAFSLISAGDFVSVYLALLNGRDPTPVDTIGRLKEALLRVGERAKGRMGDKP